MTSRFVRRTGRLAIYPFLLDQLDEAGRLCDRDLALPDEAALITGELRWAPGAMDGAFGHHAGGDGSTELAEAVARAIVSACERPTKRRRSGLYRLITSGNALDFLDTLLERLGSLGPDQERLHELGHWLATTGSDRDAVKVGIAILGVTGLDEDVDVVRALGAHEEFTLYAAVALSNGLDDAESELWALASAVEGWGRIHCVERLRATTDPAIRSWILREGFRNSVMYEYLAYIAATTGGLLEALSADEPDRDLLTAAGQILDALIDGGPAEDITNYVEGADTTEAYLSLMTVRAETLEDFQVVASIRSFLARSEGWGELSARGWSATRREVFERTCDEILGREEWMERIHAGLDSSDAAEYWRAEQAAKYRGIEIFAIQVRRIREDPLGNGWFAAWQNATLDQAVELARLASETLPMGDIATGPQDHLGIGPEWRAHQALDWSLQALRDYPDVGGDLVLVGLQSPMVRNRNMSLNVLKQWPRGRWPNGAEQLARRLAADDPNERTRTFACEVLEPDQ